MAHQSGFFDKLDLNNNSEGRTFHEKYANQVELRAKRSVFKETLMPQCVFGPFFLIEVIVNGNVSNSVTFFDCFFFGGKN